MPTDPTDDPINDWHIAAEEMRRRYQKGYSFCVDAGNRLAEEAEELEAQVKRYESLWFMRVYLWIKN